MQIFTDGTGQLINADCLHAMKEIPDRSVDMVLCDLPYGTTQNKWDSIIPLEQLWSEYWRVCRGAIVLTAQSPFDKVLAISCMSSFRYEWIWEKNTATGFMNAKKSPLKAHENILIFYKNMPQYNPQFEIGESYKKKRTGRVDTGENYGKVGIQIKADIENDGRRYPRSVLKFNRVERAIHPTQKPVALFEYLIKTYTNEGDIVLDNCAGSGTTAIAAINKNRKWICIEKDAEYSRLAVDRIKAHQKPIDMFSGI